MGSVGQSSALEYVRARAEKARAASRARILEVLARAELEPSLCDALLESIAKGASVTLNFHPDRPLPDGRTVAERLLLEGHYRSQFVTGISNGSRTAFAGGERDEWERTLFAGAYHDPIAPASPTERPKYGGLDIMQHADGACPRFGSCYLVLRPAVTARCTFTWGDSHQGPEHVGTIDAFEPVLAALLEDVAATGQALGRAEIDVPSLAQRLMAALDASRRPASELPVGRALDAYIEAQVHGDVDLSRDVARLVIDPAFEDTTTGEQLRALAAKHGIGLETHPGFVLATAEVPLDFRGPRMAPLAMRLDERFATVRGELDAVVIGRAAQSLHAEPNAWIDWGTTERLGSGGRADETLQHLKQLWHVLVRFGRAR